MKKDLKIPTEFAGEAARGLPADVHKQQSIQDRGKLDWVGMEGLKIPLKLSKDGPSVLATVSALVSLDSNTSRGIHMSRTYEMVQTQLQQNLFQGGEGIATFLAGMVQSQQGLSESAKVVLSFDWPMQKKSLQSERTAWTSYPVEVTAQLRGGESRFALKTEILYSSTCPCSAGLARELIKNAGLKYFRSQQKDSFSLEELSEWFENPASLAGSPHAQRSQAQFHMEFSEMPEIEPFLSTLILQAEASLSTPVQALVKREDEMEFARLNAQNLMFCEDSARRLKAMLSEMKWTEDYRLKVCHQESLHAHDAVAYESSGQLFLD